MRTFNTIPAPGRAMTNTEDAISKARQEIIVNRREPQLEDTAPLMLSPDYKDRFIAEYWQLKIRYERLKAFNNRIIASQNFRKKVEEPDHDCDNSLLAQQQELMGEYLHILEVRAVIEGIQL